MKLTALRYGFGECLQTVHRQTSIVLFVIFNVLNEFITTCIHIQQVVNAAVHSI